MTIRESVEKEVNIYAMYCENTVETVVAVGEIEMYTEGVLDSIKETTKKIIDAIKEFIRKTKEMFRRKIEEFKMKRDLAKIQKMWSKGINNVATVTDYVEEKKLKKLYLDMIKEANKYSQRLVNAKSEKEIEALDAELEGLGTQYNKKMDELKKTLKFKLSGDPLKLIAVDESLNFIEDTAKKAVQQYQNTCYDIKKTIEKMADDDRIESERIAAEKVKIAKQQKLQAKISAITTKCGNAITKNKSAIMSAIAAAVGSGAIARAFGGSGKDVGVAAAGGAVAGFGANKIAGALNEYSEYDDGNYSEDVSDVERYYSNTINRSRNASKDGHDPNATRTKKMRDDADRNRVRRNELKKAHGASLSGKELKTAADIHNKLAVAVNNHYRK